MYLLRVTYVTSLWAIIATQIYFFRGLVLTRSTRRCLSRILTFPRDAPWEKGSYGSIDRAVNIGSQTIVRRIESLHIVDNNIVPYNCLRPWGRGKISLAAMPSSAVSFSSLCFLLSPSPSRTGPIMDRLPGFELPYEPLPTSYRVRATAGATHQATGDHLDP